MALTVKNESKLLAKHSSIYAVGTFLNRISAFLLLPIYTRFLTPNDYGIKELVGLSTDVIGILLAGVISSGFYRFYFEYDDRKDQNEVISSSIISIACIGLLGISLLSFATKMMAQHILDSVHLYYFFLISFTAMWFQCLNNIGFDYLRANQQSVKLITLSFTKMILAISLNVYFICIAKIGVLGILITTLIVSIIMFLVLIVPLLLRIGLCFSMNKTIEMFKFSFPLMVSQMGAFVVHLSDRFFIKGFRSIADAGLYSLGYRFGTLPGNFVSTPFNQIWVPRRYELYKQEGSERVFGQIFTYFILVMIFFGLAISVLTRDVLMIMADSAFWSAYKIVPIIVMANIIFNLSAHINMGLLITKKTKYFMYINLSNGIFILFLNLFLINKYGVYGAAFATLIAFIYKVSLTYYFSSKYYTIHFEFLRIGKILLATVIIYLATMPIQFDSVYTNFLVKFSIILLFPAMLFASNFYTQVEKEKIAVFLWPKILSLKRIFVS